MSNEEIIDDGAENNNNNESGKGFMSEINEKFKSITEKAQDKMQSIGDNINQASEKAETEANSYGRRGDGPRGQAECRSFTWFPAKSQPQLKAFFINETSFELKDLKLSRLALIIRSTPLSACSGVMIFSAII